MHRSLVIAVALLAAFGARADLDLRNATRHTLDNGLEVLLLEDATFPLVSMQTVYRVGARNEVPGRTGLAHFVEHLAFRGSENFPGTGLVSSIYAVGGEWHGYTWLDQTTYFATVPANELDLLLAIEADRMARLDIRKAEVEAEKGAVLAEMQGYENDPAAELFDATLFAAFVAHPYRNNTIGFASDIRALTYDEVVDFWRDHYCPANAVLAIVGDFDRDAVLARIGELFGAMPACSATPAPSAVEPPQRGERRVELLAPASRQYFQVAWHAPAADDAAFPAFLLLQELLGGSGGVNFLHNDFGTAVREDSRLSGVSDDIATWIIPTEDPYVFLVKGSVAAGASRAGLEDAVQAAVDSLEDIPADEFEQARARLLDRLVLDVQTTEDAAHQLAYYGGIDALDALLDLPAKIAALEAETVSAIARERLRPERRTIGWLVDGNVPEIGTPAVAGPVERDTAAPPNDEPAPPVATHRLRNGIPVLLQRSSLSPTAHLLVALAGDYETRSGALAAGYPVLGTTAFSETVVATKLDASIERARDALATARPVAQSGTVDSLDPYSRFEQVVDGIAVRPPAPPDAVPAVIAVSGDIVTDAVLTRLEEAFGQLPSPARADEDIDRWTAAGTRDEHIPRALAQARVGYAVAAPPPGDPASDAWRALLYILSHDYGGRLGDRAISERGLVYYIDARYRSDGRRALVTLSAGVDPAKQQAFAELLRSELMRLKSEPPTGDEVAEAVRFRLGRAQSASQSNAEIANRLATDWLWFGQHVAATELEARLARLTRLDVIEATEAFAAGSIVRISVRSQ